MKRFVIKYLRRGKKFILGSANADIRRLWKKKLRKLLGIKPAEFTYNLGICTYFKDDAPYLGEWIEFHRLVGVEKFFLYDHASSDNYLKVLKPYIDRGIVDVIDVSKAPYDLRLAVAAYMDCIIKHEYNVKWIAFINVDEFLFSPIKDDLKEVLIDYEDYAGVGVNWQVFGSSGHIEKPAGLQIESYTKRAKKDFWANHNVKPIVNPRRVLCVNNPHCFHYINGFCVNENKRETGVKIPDFHGRKKYLGKPGCFSFSCPVSVSKLRINHYVTRSKEEGRWKIRERSKAGMATDFDGFWEEHDRNEVEDTEILRFVPRLKENLKKGI